MKNIFIALASVFVVALAITLPSAVGAPAPTNPADLALGQQQVEKLWADFAKPDLAALDTFVAPGFQSLHEDGARDWAQERVLVAELKLTPYALSDYKVTRQGDVLLVTYQCHVGETIAAARTTKEMTPRMDVFQLTDSGWKLLSHVNVRKLALTPQSNANPMMIAQLAE